ncbi:MULTISPECIES: hypothetical protein [Gordonia]|uniref:DUF222 domain-containing protein n=1 Tax=Gordonia amicalis TaxID=89053 RepID=A0ABU4DD78_9ACTN|nr:MULTISPECIES: hypothetical protein [Gordonia]ATD69062.1 hypothetical protein CNO18_00820 [Gordonia sp. 1D]KAF0967514.1 hypothetical protein BPODLACK_04035 [Gordonia sp. YY1]MCZ0911011.1 hypothetical protein [Gordonia amicalis]MCZ4580379.1 hypothetical protein [Gordonia amicalis]MDJ0453902.1 hypothetical protein [Gordonia amicalis]
MTKLGLVLRELHRAERALAVDLDTLAHRHAADHEVHHVAQDLARWSREHLVRISDAASALGVDLDPEPRTTARTGSAQEKISDLLGRRPEPGMLLLVDLRRLHQTTAGVSIDWVMLGQSAQALKNHDLLEMVSDCHPDTLRQLRWSNHMIKILAPQIVAS